MFNVFILGEHYRTFNQINHSSTTQDVPCENPQNNEDEKPNNYSEYNMIDPRKWILQNSRLFDKREHRAIENRDQLCELSMCPTN